VLQCVAVCCGVLQCVAVTLVEPSHERQVCSVCCSVLQCVAVTLVDAKSRTPGMQCVL